MLDERPAARLALEHLTSLGHERIAFIKGQSFSSGLPGAMGVDPGGRP
ncbi:MAG TPA: hypothetical protein VI653_19895 [Steroidobacteraceae bacterium]